MLKAWFLVQIGQSLISYLNAWIGKVIWSNINLMTCGLTLLRMRIEKGMGYMVVKGFHRQARCEVATRFWQNNFQEAFICRTWFAIVTLRCRVSPVCGSLKSVSAKRRSQFKNLKFVRLNYTNFHSNAAIHFCYTDTRWKYILRHVENISIQIQRAWRATEKTWTNIRSFTNRNRLFLAIDNCASRIRIRFKIATRFKLPNFWCKLNGMTIKINKYMTQWNSFFIQVPLLL